jgi:RNA polymerase sigma-70 factor (ECF subfamily)
MNLLRSQEDASDIYQEVPCYRNLHTFRFDCSFHIVAPSDRDQPCLDHLRKRKVRKEESTVLRRPKDQSIEWKLSPKTEPKGIRSATSCRQLHSRIGKVLSTLTPRERMVFELRHYQGMRLKAIGGVLGTTEEAAKNCLFRATQKMRAALGDFV